LAGSQFQKSSMHYAKSDDRSMTFKLTYSTVFDPPEVMHVRFEAALSDVLTRIGARQSTLNANSTFPRIPR
jgi:hypothetical protein